MKPKNVVARKFIACLVIKKHQISTNYRMSGTIWSYQHSHTLKIEYTFYPCKLIICFLWSFQHSFLSDYSFSPKVIIFRMNARKSFKCGTQNSNFFFTVIFPSLICYLAKFIFSLWKWTLFNDYLKVYH